MFLLKKKKTADALATFNEIVHNFPTCPQAEEAQWQLIKYYSNTARSIGNTEYYHLASEHIDFYLAMWPKGNYRRTVLKEQELNNRSQAPLKMRKSVFIGILTIALGTVIALTLGSN